MQQRSLVFSFWARQWTKEWKKNGRNLNKKTGRSIRGILKAFCNPKVPNFSPRSGRIMVRLKVDVATSKIIWLVSLHFVIRIFSFHKTSHYDIKFDQSDHWWSNFRPIERRIYRRINLNLFHYKISTKFLLTGINYPEKPNRKHG